MPKPWPKGLQYRDLTRERRTVGKRIVPVQRRAQGLKCGPVLRLSAVTSEIQTEELEDCRLVVTATIANSYRIHSLVDTGCSGYAFIDTAHARAHQLPFFPLVKPRPLRGFDGVVSQYVTHYTRASMNLSGHHEVSMFFYITRLDHYAVILGLPWLRRHRVSIDFFDYSLTFDSEYCCQNCAYGTPKVDGDVYVPLNHRKTHGLPLH